MVACSVEHLAQFKVFRALSAFMSTMQYFLFGSTAMDGCWDWNPDELVRRSIRDWKSWPPAGLSDHLQQTIARTNRNWQGPVRPVSCRRGSANAVRRRNA